MKKQWLILIEENEIVACLSRGEGDFFVSQLKEWSGSEKDDLLAALDSGMGECLSSSGDDQGPEETVFILSPFWADDQGEVLETRKKVLKEICQNLNLTPLGFLIGVEALGQYFDSFLSLYFSQKFFRVSLIRSGKTKAQKQVENGVTTSPEELVQAFRKIKGEELLPEKLVFWGEIDEEKRESFNSFSWPEKEFFEKTPEVEIFSWNDFFSRLVKVISANRDLEEKEKEQKKEPVVPVFEEKEAIGPESEIDFGFVSSDIAEKMAPKEIEAISEEEAEEIKPEPEPEEGEIGVEKEKKKFSFKLPQFKFNLLFLEAFFKGKNRLFLAAAPLLVIGFVFLGWSFSRLKVEIYATPETIKKEIEVKLDPGASQFDLEKGIIPVETKEFDLEGEKTEATTGEKLVGEKAGGEVEIFNRTNQSRIFEKGTFLLGPGGLKFALESEVSIASKTADLVSGVDRWGEVKVSVEADEIGAEYNLAGETTFSLADFSKDDFLAKNVEAFSGGTSRQIRAVSDEDRENLKNALLEELSSEAKKKLKTKPTTGQILEESLQIEIVESNYSAEEGEEKDELILKLKVKAKLFELSRERLSQLAKGILAKDLDQTLVLNEEAIKADLETGETDKKGIISGRLSLEGKAYPVLDQDQMTDRLKGKRKSQVNEIIRSYPRIYRYQLVFQPRLFKVLGVLPPKAKNIMIEIKE